MILLYHKVALEAATEWWVSADAFDRQLAALAAYEVVHLADYDSANPRHVVITFDGVYENVYEYAFPLLRKWGYPFELFVTGNYIGGDNAFDAIEPLTRFCTLEQLREMADAGGRLQWHTATHRKLAGLPESQLAQEIEVPRHLRDAFAAPHFDWFAYPHGDHCAEAVAQVQRHFKGALSCIAGSDTDRYALNRVTVLEDTRLDKSRVTVIVANYNYGAYLPEAMESVLRQSVPPDEIILIDDASTDGSQEVALRYQGSARVVLNEQNLGIVGNFNKAVSLATGDFIAFLGADNRMRSDYVERCKAALDRNADAAIAYTDMAIFGGRAAEIAQRVGAEQIGFSASERWPVFYWQFPDPTPETLAAMETRNFIHGSSMYRRKAFDQVGGYTESTSPEDHHLFRRMLAQGWKAVHMNEALIEYRQHSNSQANTVLGLQMEVARLNQVLSAQRDAFLKIGAQSNQVEQHGTVRQDDAELIRAIVADRNNLETRLKDVTAEVATFKAMLEEMRATRSWRITQPLRFSARVIRHGLVPEDRTKIAQKLRSVYRRAPLPESVRGGLRRMYHWYVARKRMAAQLQTKGVPFQLPSLRPADRTDELPDYIVWGVIDWHFRHQRPQHLAQALAASGRRVFYISANLQADARPGFAVESLDPTGRLFQIRLHLMAASSIYGNAPGAEALAQLRASTGELLEWADGRSIVSVVQHPFWHGVASVLPDSRMVYDCMDHHEGFGNNTAAILGLEQALLKDAFLTVATSDWLEKLVAEKARRCTVIRNAGEFAHFAQTPQRVFRDTEGRKVLGYVGAIAEWFDQDLVEALARRFSDCLIVLVGNDSVGARSRLAKYPNIKFVGEVPYGELPFYVHGFDVCLLPFKVIPLTLATNPVKVYEYLAAGKPVVAVDLPEMRQFGDMVEVGQTHEAFLDGAARALAAAQTAESVEHRQEFARAQTWDHRARALIEQAEGPLDAPHASVIVVTYNNLELTKSCLQSLDRYSAYPALEVIVVDNASSDGSNDYLRKWVESGPNRQLILNNDNRGFAAANNQGLAAARGEYLVLLNNDTHVTPGWLGSLIGHLRRDQSIGLIGPVTNNIGNEAKIDIQYETMEQMIQRSASFTRRHIGRNFDLRTAAFFCVAMSRSVYEKVGPLDEAFGRGFFEDDDYCRRVEGLGLRVACAEDVFVHHHLSASFNKLKVADRQALFEQNKLIYEAKWGPWEPHVYRERGGKSAGWEAPGTAPLPDAFIGQQYLNGKCTICGYSVRFFFADVALWRESLNCEHCLATSRYRSVARGILRAIREIAGVDADSLAALPKSHAGRRIRVYDTQPPFYYYTCAYPLPDMLKATGWIDVELSQYKPKLKPGQRISEGVTNQNLECLTFADGSLDLVITSDVMEHVRLDKLAHAEIYRVLRMGGVYVFTVPHERSWPETLVRVQVTDPEDPAKDVHILEPEYHGDTNSGDDSGVLSYRVYGRDLEAYLEELGFDVQYSRADLSELGILNTELYFCKKVRH